MSKYWAYKTTIIIRRFSIYGQHNMSNVQVYRKIGQNIIIAQPIYIFDKQLGECSEQINHIRNDNVSNFFVTPCN